MFAFVLPAVPLLVRVGTHAAAALSGALAYAYRDHLPRWPARGGERAAGTPRAERAAGAAQPDADVHALHGLLRQTLETLGTQARDVHTTLQHLCARQDALEHLFEAATGVSPSAEGGDGEARRGRARARPSEPRATP